MLLWELLSGRRHKNKDKVQRQVGDSVPAVAGAVANSSAPIPTGAGLHNVSHQADVDRSVHHSPLASSLSSPPSPHPTSPAALSHSPPSKVAPLFRPAVGVSFYNRTPDSIKLFKNSVLARRHSTATSLNPGLLGPSLLGASAGGTGSSQRARRRRGEDAQRFSDRRRQHKYYHTIRPSLRPEKLFYSQCAHHRA